MFTKENSVDDISGEIRCVLSGTLGSLCADMNNLGSHASNPLMWSHYADGHAGICLEFSTHNVVMCAPLRVRYLKSYPRIHVHEKGEAAALSLLLTKSDVWKYEREYRLVAQERSMAVAADTPMTDGNLLTYPEGALVAVIVGCRAEYDRVKDLVDAVSPRTAVKRAIRIPNRFELRID